MSNENKNQPKTVLSPSQVVEAARRIDRLTSSEIIDQICDIFYEFHGDRLYGDDPAIYGGMGQIGDHKVTIVGTEKGHTIESNIARNFGSPHAEGYRKAIRLFKQAEKFNRPVITLINTSGAFCDTEAEDRGVGEAIAQSMQVLGQLKVPVIAILIGEGGSGGALALATANQVWMMEQAMYSILSPEGFATILWKDASRKDEAAELMKFTATDLYDLGVIDKIIPELKANGDKLSNRRLLRQLKTLITSSLDEMATWSADQLVNQRISRFRKY
ncbi:acetyl-CoA carboxylase carboxyl transferase subunit alpha [Aerococcus urinaehominis]|uniref:acetyl-CoA carboxytransferase n=1 Tax=Aerococcus urinaehominis TaxID=128944 RepID=A0A109RGB5_9LACT|nr:carboxyltransferase subunit alpha [Aerococcus urinaehominis]AMB98499.1 acetyl-CoA carboxylase carboxyl transferase subunit alpha [Aerococcus urinaehominis]SDL80603.1 acetyl-CoA carboxylase carboxyltransferase subunit alpha [Aerococcus urinaehominis]